MTGMEAFILPALISGASATAATVGTKMLTGGAEPVKLPEAKPPVRMPDPFEERANAREELRLGMQKKKGRSSTMLDEGGDGTYLSNNLGE